MAITVATKRKWTASKVQKVLLRRVLFPIAVFVPFGYFLPELAIFYAVCGLYDVSRNRPMNLSLLQRYFLGNGFLTWVLSPINILLDLLSLALHQQGSVSAGRPASRTTRRRVKRLIDTAERENLVAKLRERSKANSRTMIFFKWYGVNVDTFRRHPGVPSARGSTSGRSACRCSTRSSRPASTSASCGPTPAGAVQPQRHERSLRVHRGRRHDAATGARTSSSSSTTRCSTSRATRPTRRATACSWTSCGRHPSPASCAAS